MKFVSYEPNRIRIFRCSCVKNFRESYVFHCLVIKVVCLCDSFAILSCCFQLVNNFFEVFSSFFQLFFSTAFQVYHNFFILSRTFFFFFKKNGEGGIWTLAPLLTTYSLSRGAPSASLGTSPNCPRSVILPNNSLHTFVFFHKIVSMFSHRKALCIISHFKAVCQVLF